MSRVHSISHSSNNNENSLNNCETYINKMLRNKRPTERPRTEGKATRDKSVSRPNNNQLTISRPMVKVVQPTQTCTVLRAEEPKRKVSSQELVHKEVFNNNMATVEVTVRTVAPKGAEAKGNPMIEELREREPWGKILTARRSEENVQCSFGNFDPLRTLHFLSKELQLKLQNLYPGDPSVHQIVYDMQNAMQRLPPDIMPQFKSSTAYCFPNTNIGDNEPPTNLKKSNQEVRKISTQTQTVIIGDTETKKMQQLLEDSTIQLETRCNEFENSCKKLRSEREELEGMLATERETVQSLKKQVAEKNEKIAKEIHKLMSEREELKNQVQDLQTKAVSQVNSEDLRSLVAEIGHKHLTAEQENTAQRNELTLMKLEREKMNVLLECRDKQLRELRNELECIQQHVSSQLVEFKAKNSFSSTSTNMTSTSQLWNVPSIARTQKGASSIHDLFLNNDVMRKMLLSKDLQIAESGTFTTMNADEIIKEQNLQLQKMENEVVQEIPQREKFEDKITSQTSISDVGTEKEFMHKLSSPSIINMFAEIKRQAFKKLDVNLPPVPQKSNNISSVSQEIQDDHQSHTSMSS